MTDDPRMSHAASDPDAFWTHESIRLASGGVWIARPAAAGPTPRGVSIDTRTLTPGQVFVAIAGERTDGHNYLAQAHAGGASLAIVERDGLGEAPEGLGIVRVASSLGALQRLARAYRRTLGSTRVVAVTGSCGKTTTTRLIDAVLGASLRGTASIKSYNNHLGVALTILGASARDRYLVAEVGSSAPGEIAQLAAMLRPDVAVITSVGPAHLAGLGSLAGVAHEKAALARSLGDQGLAIVATAGSPGEAMLDRELIPVPSVLRVGLGHTADLEVVGIAQDDSGLTLTLADRTSYRVGLLGAHNALNAALAIAVGRRCGLDHEAIARGLASARAEPGRLAPQRIGPITVLDDSYNANPQSMRAGLETLVAVGRDAARRVAILGDMLELADHSESAHAELGAQLAAMDGIDRVVLVGEAMAAAHEAMADAGSGDRCVRVVSGDDLDTIRGEVLPGDCVLIKGSRGMALERVIAALRAAPRVRTVDPARARIA